MHEPVTPAGLPRNREADAWREDARMWTRVAFASWYVALGLLIALSFTEQERDAARAQVSAAEQRAEMAEAVRDAAILRMDSVMPGQRSVFVCPRDGACALVQDCVPDTAPPRVIYDDVGIQRWDPAGTVTVPGTARGYTSGMMPAGPVTLPGTIPHCPAPVGTLCLYDGDRGQP